ncbi:hypothetical protein An17g01520 [Aspergillus niger]|uniref:Uncharacterized protein n=2 Tax=Aspergillus niger TaxID=5061 RepID=A2R9I2_ASPNC|nr:hypothetical protein An17g01520 [Aspergillus niger]CAK43048.1 hypothetical protein An17g01520 [Aspergillus niger]
MTKIPSDGRLMNAIDVYVRRIIRVFQVKGRESFVALCSCVLVVLPGMTDRGLVPGDTDKEAVTEPRAGFWSLGRGGHPRAYCMINPIRDEIPQTGQRHRRHGNQTLSPQLPIAGKAWGERHPETRNPRCIRGTLAIETVYYQIPATRTALSRPSPSLQCLVRVGKEGLIVPMEEAAAMKAGSRSMLADRSAATADFNDRCIASLCLTPSSRMFFSFLRVTMLLVPIPQTLRALPNPVTGWPQPISQLPGGSMVFPLSGGERADGRLKKPSCGWADRVPPGHPPDHRLILTSFGGVLSNGSISWYKCPDQPTHYGWDASTPGFARQERVIAIYPSLGHALLAAWVNLLVASGLSSTPIAAPAES